ncbi:MFS general substrate transporter [Trametes meyenii]|nr:MFS general substrate transporter [Trametes meyenii]
MDPEGSSECRPVIQATVSYNIEGIDLCCAPLLAKKYPSEEGSRLEEQLEVGPGDYKALYPDVNETKLVRRVDMRVIPIITVLYFLAFLDRVNISNATLFNLKQDLKLTGNQFNTALVVFFVPFVLFEIPSNILLKRFRPHVWLPLCMFLFGLITILQGFTHSFGGLVAARFFLGLAEAGFLPGCCYLIAMWYKREEVQKRFSFFHSSATLAGGVGGLLASAIGKMDGIRGYHGWRWIFILEGAFTVVVAILAYFVVPDFLEDVRWLSDGEKAAVKARLYDDIGNPGSEDSLTFKAVVAALKDCKRLLLLETFPKKTDSVFADKMILGPLMYFGMLVPAYGYAYFAPTIIQTFGHGVIETQLLSVPPWACAFVFTMAIATVSDHTRRRFPFVLLCSAIALAGYIVLLVVHDNRKLQYGALYVAEIGAVGTLPLVMCWFETNLGNHQRRAVGTALQIGFGNIGGIIAAYTFLEKDAPRYIPGYAICIGFTALSVVSSCAYYVAVRLENRRRTLLAPGSPDMVAQEKASLGDLNPKYRYFT